MRLKLGMVGGGEGAFIGAVHRLAARMDDEFELVAGAFSSNEQNCQRTGQRLHLAPERCYASYQQMAQSEAARGNGIDVVAIVTPNHLHAPIAVEFLRSGIDVICDKPLCTSYSEALQLADVVRETGRQLILTHNYSAYPLIREARSRILAGELGEIRYIEVEYLQQWLATRLEETENKQANWRTDPKKAGAGCIGDIGTHAWQLASFVTGMLPESIRAELTSMIPERVLDDDVRVQMRYHNGAKGRLWASQVACGEENGLRLRIYGSQGSLSFSQENPNQLWLKPFDSPMYCVTRGSMSQWEENRAMSRVQAGHPEGYLEGFAQVYREAATRLREGSGASPLLPGIETGLQGMAFIDAAKRSHDSCGQWIDFTQYRCSS
ncbi:MULTISPECIES: Gfo/Idh/MocA family protein [Providencia]|uniref:Gfo/Idh/MocA family protein n=1 Tax=Providencia TaxID=586 RepID=UPI001ADBB43B|nr:MULTISPECIES: Gfo/Idh/MocA family oxidoreductase [Providencia]MBO8254682.1 Gfo/Idh/MocA family oxidoreductase [Providencia rettgeri]MBO8258452.1 Gfo/Idh/MocA family oxidoreductase [Providencia rettgeri]MDE4730999.1 Gfo/Idh/MocA family oxidoreductase [Providencia rettgeri]